MGHLASGGGRSPGASLSVPVGGRAKALPWWRTPSVRRHLFGYTLLAPAVLYVGVLVGAPFLFSLYLALSDASVGARSEEHTSELQSRPQLVCRLLLGTKRYLSSICTLPKRQQRTHP